MHKFKIGDMVRVLAGSCRGKIGTIAHLRIGMTLDIYFKGWDGGHGGEYNSDSLEHWFIQSEWLELAEPRIKLTKKERIINKIIEMKKRRESLGYKY